MRSFLRVLSGNIRRDKRTLLGVMFLLNVVSRNRVTAWATRTISTGLYSSLLKARVPSPSGTWTRQFASSSSSDEQKGKKKGKRKFKVAAEINQDKIDKLAAAFDELARKDGFDSSTAKFADDSSFEEPFGDDDIFLDDDEDFVDEDAASDSSESKPEGRQAVKTSQDQYSNGDNSLGFNTAYDDMDNRISAARRDMDMGRVTVDPQLDKFSKEISPNYLRELGFRQETNPFGDDETPRKNQFQLVTDSMICSACGSDFQCSNETRPGYLPPEKFEIQVKLSKLEEMRKLKDKAGTTDWSPEDEVEWLIQTSGQATPNKFDNVDIDINSLAEEMSLDLVSLAKKKIICKRCHGLQNFGVVEKSLRPGWTEDPLLSQEKFRHLLQPIRDKPAVIIALVDVFDFAGSVLPELDNIAGDNPVIIAANKADLLPSQMGPVRVENWVRRELEYMGVKSLANVGGAVRLVSCKTGDGVGAMLSKARSLAEEMDCDIYLVGAANAGKSTLLNRLLSKTDDERSLKVRAGNLNARKGAVTTSPLPGTTLRFIKVNLGDGRALYDTPGLLVPGTLTQLLTPEELKIVVPFKRVEPITFRVAAGKCVLIGGLARIELIDDCKPFFFTFFVANGIKLHPTDASRADEYISKHVGELLTPPLPPGPIRLEELGEFQDHIFEIAGNGWKQAAADIALTGLGWIAVTGAGTAKIKVSLPKGVAITVRPPLMPLDVWDATASYTGGRAYRKSTKSKSGKRRKGVGRM